MLKDIVTKVEKSASQIGGIAAASDRRPRLVALGHSYGSLVTAEALRLTETVNQAVRLSGASAQASEAALTQLIQGLQGGVLRGDEFNSVMEQAPRLAKALADGLGVTTGALRTMAEAGQLSSETVIRALQGQARAVGPEARARGRGQAAAREHVDHLQRLLGLVQ